MNLIAIEKETGDIIEVGSPTNIGGMLVVWCESKKRTYTNDEIIYVNNDYLCGYNDAINKSIKILKQYHTDVKGEEFIKDYLKTMMEE